MFGYSIGRGYPRSFFMLFGTKLRINRNQREEARVLPPSDGVVNA